MSQYALEPLEHRLDKRPYREWPISEPTTRRCDLYLHPPGDEKNFPPRDGKLGRIVLRQNIYGDNHLDVATTDMAEYRAIVDGPEWRTIQIDLI